MNLVKRNLIALWLRSVVIVLANFALWIGCKSEEHHPGYAANQTPIFERSSEDKQDSCISPNLGCDCSNEGASIACGNVVETYENYVTCSRGTRLCQNGKWGDCIGEISEQKTTQSVTKLSPGSIQKRSILSLGSTSSSCDNPCDPMCNQVADSSGDFDAGLGFVNDTTGLSLERAVLVGCDSLTITPASTTATVTQIIPSVTAAPIKLTAKLTPSCMVSPFPVSWTVDRFDIASITGTNDTNGEFSVLHATAGDVTVTAYAAGLSATTKIRVVVNTNQSTSTSPNEVATSSQVGKFTGNGTVATRVTWLYPYANTYFPIGLLAPVIQYSLSLIHI